MENFIFCAIIDIETQVERLSPFLVTCFFLYSLILSEKQIFSYLFPGGIKRNQCHKMNKLVCGKVACYFLVFHANVNHCYEGRYWGGIG